MRIYEHMTATEHKTNLYMIISCNCNHIRLEIVLNTYDGMCREEARICVITQLEEATFLSISPVLQLPLRQVPTYFRPVGMI